MPRGVMLRLLCGSQSWHGGESGSRRAIPDGVFMSALSREGLQVIARSWDLGHVHRGEEAGKHEGKGDASEDVPARGAEVGGGLLEGGIDVGQRGDDVEVHDGVEVKALEEDDTPEGIDAEPVDGGIVETEEAEGL